MTNIINRTDAADTITFTDTSTTVNAGEGANTITGTSGDNVINSGDGVDTITVTSGDNTINAGGGANTITATSGINEINTGDGADTITTGGLAGGGNTVNAGDGANTITTGAGDDTVTGGSGVDTITTGAGDDVVDAGNGANTITTGAGNDIVYSGIDIDTITTGAGDDTIHIMGGTDTIIAGADTDTLIADLSLATSAVSINALAGNVAAGYAGNISGLGIATFTGVENFEITSGDFNDTITTGDGTDIIRSGAGSDIVNLAGGNDEAIYTMAANTGASDVYQGGAGVDTLTLEFTEAEWLSAGVQADIVDYLAFQAANTGGENSAVFQFNAFNLSVSEFEALNVTVNGVVFDPADAAVTAVNDAETINEDISVATSFASVLVNDTVPDLIYSVTLVSGPSEGLLVFNPGGLGGSGTPPDGSFTFNPNSDFEDLALGESRDVSFVYEVQDADGDTDLATVIITVTGSNDAPVITVNSLNAGVDEANGGTITGTLALTRDTTFTDIDTTDTGHVYNAITAGTATTVADITAGAAANVGGVTVELGTTGAYTLTGAGLDNLAAGEQVTVSFNVTITDGDDSSTAETVVLTVTGTNEEALLPATFGVTFNGIHSGDFAGYSVSSAGDVNGDGTDDILIGAPRTDAGGRESGQSYVVFGKDIATDGEFAGVFNLETLDGTNGFAIDGVDAWDRSGQFVSSARDVNGDGIDDILIGAYLGGLGGETYVVFGKNTATEGDFAATLDLGTLDGTNGFALSGIEAGDWFGISVSSAGDVNGDGVDDILIGASKGGTGGEVYVVFGKDTTNDDFAANLDLATLDGTNGFTIEAIDPADNTGWSVSSAGDVDGDGFDDILVGGLNGANEVYVVFGKDTATDGDFGATLDLGTLDGTNGFIVEGFTTLGRSVSSAGDINGDGFDDIIFGDTYASPKGEAYVVFGQDTAVDGDFAATLDLATLDGTNGFTLSGVASATGISVSSAGDVNADGIDDFLVGSHYAGNTGAAYLLFGKVTDTDGDFAATIDLGDLDGSDGFVFRGINTSDNAGFAVHSAGDVNGDGFDDILIGARAGDPSGSNSGETYLVFGGADILALYDKADGTSDGAINLSLLGNDPLDFI
jgi:hypothetical protein